MEFECENFSLTKRDLVLRRCMIMLVLPARPPATVRYLFRFIGCGLVALLVFLCLGEVGEERRREGGSEDDIVEG